jgi:anaerobic dimethyl sulfoxide reductase subunit B (iron-sulfur subunit)
MQYGFYFDANRCIGCNACAVACKEWNEILPGAGVAWRRVTSVESGKVPNLKLVNMSNSCNHCAKPACVGACPVSAISKRAEDGIVLVDQTKCIGCKTCSIACPFGVPQFGPSGKMQKCNLCLDRVKLGQVPECASSCTGGALFAGPMDQLTAMAISTGGIQMAGVTQPSLLIKLPK